MVLSIFLTTIRPVNHKEVEKKTPSKHYHTSISDRKRDSEGPANEEKVIFVLKLLGPVLPVHSH